MLAIRNVVVGIALALATFLLGCEHPFDSALWKSECGNNADEIVLRREMLESLETDYLKSGMNRHQVKGLLGEANGNESSLGKGWLGLQGGFDAYLVGSQKTIDYDLIYYVIEYDDQNRVTRFETRVFPG